MLSPSQNHTHCVPKNKAAVRHWGDGHVSVGHLNSVGSPTLQRMPYRAAGAGPRRLAGYLPSCTGVDLGRDRKERLGRWLSGSSLHSRIMSQIGFRSARWEKGGIAGHEQHIKHILKKETGGIVGRGRGEIATTVYCPPPHSVHRMRPRAGLAFVLFPAAALGLPELQKQFVYRRIVFCHSLAGCTVFLHCTFQSHRGPSVHHCYRRVTGWWPWNLCQNRFSEPLWAVEPAELGQNTMWVKLACGLWNRCDHWRQQNLEFSLFHFSYFFYQKFQV